MNELFDNLSDFLSKRPGLLPIVGIALIILNLILHAIFSNSIWLTSANLFLHLGLVVALVGFLLIKPLQ